MKIPFFIQPAAQPPISGIRHKASPIRGSTLYAAVIPFGFRIPNPEFSPSIREAQAP
jgi:hypothetical protein